MEQFRICKDCNFSGVYAIVNISKQKIYIGSTRNIKQRLINHKTKLNHGENPNEKIRDWKIIFRYHVQAVMLDPEI